MQTYHAYDPVRFKPQSLRHTTTTYPQQHPAAASAGADTAQPKPAPSSAKQPYYSASNPRPDSVIVQHTLQDKYQLEQLPCEHTESAVAGDANAASSTDLKAELIQQHARKQQQKQQRISAVRASAAAVSRWTQQQLQQGLCASSSLIPSNSKQSAAPAPAPAPAPAAAAAPFARASAAEHPSRCQPPSSAPRTHKLRLQAMAAQGAASVTSCDLQQLPPSVLQVMSSEAERGLLHLQALGLLPPQLEVTHALIGAPGTPVQMHAAALHTLTANRNSSSSTKEGATSSSSSSSAQANSNRQDNNQRQQQGRHRKQQDNAHGPLSAQQMDSRGAAGGGDQLQLLIYAGHLVQDSTDMVSLVQAAAEQGVWRSTAALLAQLQALCRAFAVPLAVIDGCMVLRLASSLSKPAAGSTAATDAAAGAGVALQQSAQHQQLQTAEPLQQGSGPCKQEQGAGCITGYRVQQAQIGLADLLACFMNLDDVAPYLDN